ncbi:MAG: hypothetical protein ACXWT7_10795 [Methylophilaceae bacterium]
MISQEDEPNDNHGDSGTDLGIEVAEVDFSEFDRRKKTSEATSYRKYERRGFVGEVDTLIQEIHIKMARAYSTKHWKK